MSEFDRQLQNRKLNDDIALQNAYEYAVNAIVGESFSFDESKEALALILKYYKLEQILILEELKDDDEKLIVFCQQSGLMQRQVRLEKGWYKDTFGAYLCRIKETGEMVAVIPNKWGKYHFYDKTNHKRYTLNKQSEELLEDRAICFYKSLPEKKLKVIDLLRFSFSSLNVLDMISILLVLVIATLLGLLSPKLMNFLFSTVVTEKSYALLISTMVFIVCLGVSTLFLNSMKSFFTNRINVKINATIQSASIMRVLALPPKFFHKYTTGELSTRMSYMSTLCTQILSTSFVTLLSSLFSLSYITQIFRFTPSLTVVSVVILLVNGFYLFTSTLRQMSIYKEAVELSAKENGKAIEILNGIQKIKMAGGEKRIFANYAKTYADIAKLTYNPPAMVKYNSVISTALSLLSTLLLYYLAVKNNVNVAEYYAFQAAYAQISASITSLVAVATQMANLYPSIKMIQPILDVEPETKSKDKIVSSLRGDIELTNVTFKYDDSPVNILENLSLKIKAGEYVAIVGKTGCGKSTLMRLLLGFDKPQLGAIYYDGMDINTLDKRSLRRRIGTVMQDDKLFNDDIYSNISICAPNLTMNEAWEAAEKAGIAEDIRKMPMGMQTLISEGSGGISGGQRQRLVIARAIASKPKVLFFDEATSALDNITQKKVSESLDQLKCTRVVIAHRLSTIKHCDRILVMDQGKIVDHGTYEELIKTNEFFANLVARQRLDD